MILNTHEPTESGVTLQVIRPLTEAAPGGEGTPFLAEAGGHRFVIKAFANDQRLDVRRQRTKQLVEMHLDQVSPLLAAPIDVLARQDLVAHVTPYVDGDDLDEITYAAGQLVTDLHDDLSLGAVIAQAAGSLHALGMLHGDLHPRQFRVRRVGNHFECRLLDLDNYWSPNAPRPFMLGHPDYLGPSLRRAYLAGVAALPSRADEEFSLGVVALETILHRHPKPVDAKPDSPELHLGMLGPWADEPKRSDRSGLSGGSGYPSRVLNTQLINLARRTWNEAPGGMPTAVEWRDACVAAAQRVGVCPACDGPSVGDPRRRQCPYCQAELPVLGLHGTNGAAIGLDQPVHEVGRVALGGGTTVSARHCIVRREPPVLTVECVGLNGMEIDRDGAWTPLVHAKPTVVRAGDRLRIAQNLEFRVAPMT